MYKDAGLADDATAFAGCLSHTESAQACEADQRSQSPVPWYGDKYLKIEKTRLLHSPALVG